MSTFYNTGVHQALNDLGLEKEARIHALDIARNAIMDLVPMRLRSKAVQQAAAKARAMAEAPLPPEAQAQYDAVYEWMRTHRVPRGWRVTHEGMGLERMPPLPTPTATEALPSTVMNLSPETRYTLQTALRRAA